jgi:hypothetical protein
MYSDRYVHPEFGLLSPTPRFRRELRTVFFSVLFGIGIGAAAVVALSGNNNGDDAGVSHGVSSASVVSDNSPQAADIKKEANKDHTSKPDGSTAEAKINGSKAEANTNAATTCEGNNSSCNAPPPAAKPRGLRVPAANDALAIARAPLGRSDASAWMTPPSASSERGPEGSTTGPSQQRNAEDAAADGPASHLVTHRKPRKTARSQTRPRQEAPREERAAYWNGRGYDRPVGDLGRAYTHDRSYGVKGFWAWSD